MQQKINRKTKGERMTHIMTTAMGRNGIKIATARVFTDPREAWEYGLFDFAESISLSEVVS
jgi:hypothetical protein